MTYKKIYSQLERAGLIEKLLAQSNFDKVGIMDGIAYLENFVGSGTFKDMKYWKDSKCEKTVAMVCVEYARLQMANSKKHLAKFEYMINAMQ